MLSWLIDFFKSVSFTFFVFLLLFIIWFWWNLHWIWPKTVSLCKSFSRMPHLTWKFASHVETEQLIKAVSCSFNKHIEHKVDFYVYYGLNLILSAPLILPVTLSYVLSLKLIDWIYLTHEMWAHPDTDSFLNFFLWNPTLHIIPFKSGQNSHLRSEG